MGDNSSGFMALPGGWQFNTGWLSSSAGFSTDGSDAYFWSDTDFDGTYAWHRNLSDFNNGMSRNHYFEKENGLSVRCVKN